jgi:hypothetical protein
VPVIDDEGIASRFCENEAMEKADVSEGLLLLIGDGWLGFS